MSGDVSTPLLMNAIGHVTQFLLGKTTIRTTTTEITQAAVFLLNFPPVQQEIYQTYQLGK